MMKKTNEKKSLSQHIGSVLNSYGKLIAMSGRF